MANAKIVHVTRESVLLAWDSMPGAAAYSVARVGPIESGEEDPENRLLAAVYESSFCDATLTAGSRYTYTLTLIPAPDAEDVEEDVQRLGVRTLPETEFPDGRAFFEGFLRPTFHRHLDPSTRWCERWWAHPEAAYVVDQLWAAYEALRPPEPPEPPGKQRAEWLVGYFYPLFERLLLPLGTFEGCSVTAREAGERDSEWHDPKAKPLLHAAPSPLP